MAVAASALQTGPEPPSVHPERLRPASVLNTTESNTAGYQ
ncbi:hypothetical protein MMEU_1162 [Mycobacterium marinum str. Europe]|nr:hypothetical protein MMEU_1162 [Mycobacterium marinum str. Europe]